VIENYNHVNYSEKSAKSDKIELFDLYLYQNT